MGLLRVDEVVVNLALLPKADDERRVADVIAARTCSSPPVVGRRLCLHEHEWICPLCGEPDDECRCGR